MTKQKSNFKKNIKKEGKVKLIKDKEQRFSFPKKGQKMILMGFDGAMPYFVKRFAEEGKTPNTARLIKSGFFADAYSTPPCDTPTNWATIATGADTGVHGVTSNSMYGPDVGS